MMHDRARDIIDVVGRNDAGERIFTQHAAQYGFYYPDPKGKFTSIFGDKLGRFNTTSRKAFLKEKKSFGNKLFESDVNVVFRCISENYLDAPVPKLNIAFFDIEVDFHKENGFAPPDDPFNAITAISVHPNWLDRTVCLVIKPSGMSQEEADDIVNSFASDVYLLDTEEELLQVFLELIGDADILSGWNSESFDIPYTTNRISRVLGKSYTRQLCLWDQFPKKRMYESYGKEQETYDLVGRIHMDYMQLYKKYTYHEMHSYSLDTITEHELGEKKVDYEGTLDQLYNNDFKKFIEYSIQDTSLLRKLDDKLQFIDLSNVLAHANGVLLPTTMGAVAQTDQAIINEAHGRGLIVPDKVRGQAHIPAAGAYVATPVTGMHNWIGSIDLNSLYPSILRSCNMSPECIVGQVRHTLTNAGLREVIMKGKGFADEVSNPDDMDEVFKFGKSMKDSPFPKYWEGRFACDEYLLVVEKDKGTELIIDFEGGESYTTTGAEIHDLVFNSGKPWCISSNGTIFTFEKQGVIPGLLARWYSERKVLQMAALLCRDMKDSGFDLQNSMLATDISALMADLPVGRGAKMDPFALAELVIAKDAGRLARYMVEFNLVLDGTIMNTMGDKPTDADFAFWDKRQLVKKINLNSLYGALLNPGSRFTDPRLGQSTTLTGRTIARHMSAATNEVITGLYDHVGQSIIYGDTDSVYFSAYPAYKDQIDSGEFKWDKDTIIELYDAVGNQVNETFTGFMADLHNCPAQYGKIIAASRESVAESGMFISKKRYGLLVYDDEGKRVDINGKRGKLKVTGLEIKRSDTPAYMQEFLKEILQETLEGASEDAMITRIREFRQEFKDMPPWEKGTPKRVNNLTTYTNKWGKTGKCGVGHVMAAINYNRLIEMHNDKYSLPIIDGMKTIVCKLKPNPLGMTSIGIPTDEKRIPDWYKELPFDNDLMEETIITKKISNLLGTLDWDLSRTETKTTFHNLFDF
jgi:DNA polymerase elongation subunit (family B)